MALCTNHALKQNIIFVHKTQNSPIFYGGSERNKYKTIRKLRNKDCIKQKSLRHKIGIKRGKN